MKAIELFQNYYQENKTKLAEKIRYYNNSLKDDDLILNGNNLFTCSQCNYHADTFKYFIYNLPKEDNNNNNGNGFNENDTIIILNPPPPEPDFIAIIFSAIDQTIHYPVACKLTDSFQIIENKLIKEYP